MIISDLYNIAFNDITEDYDLFIGVVGDEPRSYYLATKTDLFQKAKNKYILKYNNNIPNPDGFPEGVEWVENDENNENPIWSIVEKHLVGEKEKLSIIVDYSSMSRLYYGAFLRSCYEYKCKTKLVLCFVYNIAQPVPPPVDQSFSFEPMPGYLHLKLPQNPTALIIGLGYEERRAYSLKDYFDAEAVYIFRTDRKTSPEYYDLVEKNNDRLLKTLSQRGLNNVFEYSLDNICYTHKVLSDLCQELSNSYRIIIAPCGPKPFTLMSLLVSLRLENVDIWRIHNVDNVVKKEGSDQSIVTIIEMIPDNREAQEMMI